MATNENEVKKKVILDIDGILSRYKKRLKGISDEIWKSFIEDNNLYMQVWEKIDILSPAALPFIIYLIKNNFDIYFSTTRPKEITIPYLQELNRRLVNIMGDGISLDLTGNRVFTKENQREDRLKDIARQLGLKSQELSNTFIADDTPQNIEIGQKRFALKMREYNTSQMSSLVKYVEKPNGDLEYIAFASDDFQKLNSLYYATGLIETILDKIRNGDKRNFEDILFELQFGKPHTEVDEIDMFHPLSLENMEYYTKGLSVLRKTMVSYHLGYPLDLILPSTYRPNSEAAKKCSVKNDEILFTAVKNERFYLLKYLLTIIENSNVLDKDGNTPLHYACESGALDIVRLLHQHNANVNATDNNLLTPLHYAVKTNKQEVVEFLVAHGAMVDAKSKYGNTPFHYAAVRNNLVLCKFLVEAGANIHEKDNDGETALHLAAKSGYCDTVKWLLDVHGFDINLKSSDGTTPLHFATIKGYIRVVQFLLENGANIHEKDDEDCTALYFAASRGHIEVVRFLLDKGANIHEKDDEGDTALHIAAARGHIKIVQFLLENGANIHEKDNDGDTALHYAAARGHKEVVRLLLDKGAEVNAKNNKGYTALHCAAKYGHDNIINLLLKRGADKSISSNAKETALDIALQYEKQSIVTILREVAEEQNSSVNSFATVSNVLAQNSCPVKKAKPSPYENSVNLIEAKKETLKKSHESEIQASSTSIPQTIPRP